MLLLIAIPVFLVVGAFQRYLAIYAPTNILIRRVRSARPCGRGAAALLGLAAVLFLTMHVVANAVSAGAPGWLNLVVLVFAWDALKVGWLAVGVIRRSIVGVARQALGRASRVRHSTS